MNSSNADDSFGSIAIVGLSGRFPGARNLDNFWRNLRDGVESISFFTDQELASAGVDAAVLNDPRYVKAGSFLDDIELFDASFFGISPREAQVMDPQHRLFMETAWEALESAGYNPQSFAGQIGVYAGASISTYLLFNLHQTLSAPGFVGRFQSLIGNDKDYLATHTSYKLNLQGPSVGVQTACSSSLVAVCLACQSLLTYQCEIAIAGGVTVRVPKKAGYFFEEGAILSPDGHCRAFDARARGTVFGSGVGVVVLKRLEDALKDRDVIHAVIKGSAINNDGSRKIGFTAPGVEGQAKVVAMAQALAGVEPETISYVETHGTGTALGDPIEIDALTQAFRAGTAARNFCGIGSVKTNVGHLESAAGIASLIKTVLALKNKQLPPSLHFEQPNPEIDFAGSPFYVNASLANWKTGPTPRRAGVSSFGIGGTNAHVVLEEAPEREVVRAEVERPVHLLTLSAKSEVALQEQAQRFSRQLSEQGGESLADICYTANSGRAHFGHRLAVVAKTVGQTSEQLAAFAAGEATAELQSSSVENRSQPRVAFLFTGQGSQYAGMGRELYETQPSFRRRLQECDELLRPHLEQSLLAVMYGGESELLEQTAYTQPALFALEYALAELWRSWGVEPSAVMGHSLGEYVAACVAGVFTLAEGLKLVAARGRLMQGVQAAGGMAAVFAGAEQVRAALAPYAEEVAIAAMNTPGQVVISGGRAAVAAVVERLRGGGVRVEELRVSQAFHSPLMEEILDQFEQEAAGISYRVPRLPLIANVTGAEVSRAAAMNASYWRQQVRGTVQFREGMETLAGQGTEIYVEVGPSATLLGMGRECVRAGGAEWIATMRRGRGEWPQLLEGLGRLYLAGVKVHWQGFDSDYQRRRVMLPTYPFQRERYWIEAAPLKTSPSAPSSEDASRKDPLLGSRLLSPLGEIQYESKLSSESPAFLQEHQVYEQTVVPAAAFLEMVIAAAADLHGATACEIEGFVIREPLVLTDGDVRTLQLILQPEEQGTAAFQILSLSAAADGDGSWQLHVSGKLLSGQLNIPIEEEKGSLESLQTQFQGDSLDSAAFYQGLQQQGIHLGPRFQGIEHLWLRDGEALGQIRIPPAQDDADRYRLHPCLIDSCCQLLAATLPTEHLGLDAFAPISLESFRFNGRPGEGRWSHAVLRPSDTKEPEAFVGDIRLLDEDGQVLAEMKGLCIKRASRAALLRGAQPRSLPEELKGWLYQVDWQPKALPNSDVLESPDGFSISDVDEELQARVAQLGSDHGLELYQQLLPELDALSVGYVLRALQQLGWYPRLSEQVSLASLAESLSIMKQHHRLLGRMLEMLEEEGLLRKTGSQWQVLRVPTVADTHADCARLQERYPFGNAEITLLERCGQPLAEILRGTLNPLQVLFPGGSLQALERLYQDSPGSRVYNTVVREIVGRSLEHFPESRTLRILEVGAGTGSTTSYLLERFAGRRLEYVFTDLSPLFLTKAAQKFKAYKFVRYQILDIERDPNEQGFSADKFDLIVAANVLHATTDLRQTLQNVQRLLTDGGKLVLLEGTGPQRWVDLTFGLTDGWWKFADSALRPAYPLLSRDTWVTLLREMGFCDVATIGGEAISERISRPVVISAAATTKREERVARSRTGSFLIFADRNGVGEKLAKLLRKQGEKSVLVYPGTKYEATGEGQWHVDPTRTEDFERIVKEATGSAGEPCRGVVHLWSLDNWRAAETTLLTLEEDQKLSCGSLLNAVQAMVRAGAGNAAEAPRLWVVTRGAQTVGADTALDVAQSPVWGLGQVIALEHPDLHCVCLDLDPSSQGDAEIQTLFREIWLRDKEGQIALRDGVRYVARLGRTKSKSHGSRSQSNPSGNQPFQLEMSQRGVLDNLILKSMTRRSPGNMEIEIRVRATGLNFRDVLNALGMRPGDDEALGGECSGEIVALGEGVNNYQVGDKVIGLAPASFSSFVTTHADLVVAKPEFLSFEDGASIPVVFLTAHYALHRLAKMAAGDRVLVHAAAGGVGLAAVQLAQRAGAVIFATAGSPEKREFLRRLGVQYVMDSRSGDFAEEVLRQTGGQGVNIVLNSLAGEFIARSFAVLAEGGRFLEIGKTAIWSKSQVAQLEKKVSYFVVELDKLMVDDPSFVGSMFRDLMRDFESYQLKPLPRRIFPMHDVVSAFRFMAQAKHIGKIVVSQDHPTSAPEGPFTLLSEGTYLITGGLGGLGLVCARWMVEKGARNLVLVGRGGASDEALALKSELERFGVKVVAAQADVSKEKEIAQVLKDISVSMPPLRGIIHAAGVLDDGVLMRQNWARFANVMAPKVAGSWNLHVLTQDMPLDFFVLFSSSASLLGSPGQGNHAAANTFLDKLAQYRRAQGLTAVSINWGGWASVGAAARRKPDSHSAALGSISKQQGLQILEYVLSQELPQVGVLPIDWPEFLREFPVAGESVLFSEIAKEAGQRQQRVVRKATPAPELLRQLDQASPGERYALLAAHVEAQIIQVLSLDSAQRIDRQRPLNEFGLDSLMAIELRNVLGLGVGRSLPATLLFDYPTVEALTKYLATEVLSLELIDASTEETQNANLRTNLESRESSMGEPLAIIGMGCRFPGGADTPEGYWELLREGVDAISEVPAERWDIDAYYDARAGTAGKMNTRYGGFIKEVEQFDPQFFGIAPREAISMDPQQRLVLEVGWEALEHAGQAADKLVGSATGVFIGISNSDYGRLMNEPEEIDTYTSTGISLSIAAGRLSYVLGLQGPSLAVDTACSSSLVAVHLACQSLRNRECGMALAGGVNLILTPLATIALSELGMMAPDGRCKTFGREANGFVRGEGCGLVVLKRLSDAQAAGDRILGLIRGTAINQDGRSSGLTAPNGPAQEAVIRKALADGGVRAEEVSYVEAHGTGTALGDPIEVGALGAVLGEQRKKEEPLMIGSVKTNIGHLEAAAGVSGLMKVVLALQHQEVPPHLHLRERSEHIAWEELGVTVPTERRPWPAGQGGKGRRIAGVSSFGFGGTNAHVVLEEAPEREVVRAEVERPVHLLTLSAKSEVALQEQAQRFSRQLSEQGGESLADICYTANSGRAHFGHRLAVVAKTVGQTSEQLGAFAAGEATAELQSSSVENRSQPRVAFLFTGQGSQYAGMGRELYETQPSFRRRLQECDELLRPHLEQSLLAVMYGGESELLEQTAYTQPALFALEYALAELWRSWGVEPSAVMGHSLGEYVAACVAGVFTLAEGLKLVAARGRLMQGVQAAGGMAAVFAGAEQVRAALAPYAEEVAIAAMNTPGQVVISGGRAAVAAVVERLRGGGVRVEELRVSQAFHSPLMEEILDQFEQEAAGISYRVPRLPLIANVTGAEVSRAAAMNASYWRQQVRGTVQFREGMETLAGQGTEIYVEVGPSATLLGMGRECVRAGGAEWIATMRRGRGEWPQLLEGLGRLYLQGVEVNWRGVDEDYQQQRRLVVLPRYPFQRKRYWIEETESGPKGAPRHQRRNNKAGHPLLGHKLRSALPQVSFEIEIRTTSTPFLNDHQVYGVAVMPASSYLEMALAAASEIYGAGSKVLEDVVIHEVMVLSEDHQRTVQLILQPEGERAASFRILSLSEEQEGSEESWVLHTTGKVRAGEIDAVAPACVSAEAVQRRCHPEVAGEEFYQKLDDAGLQFGQSGRGIEKLWRRDGEALGRIVLPQALAAKAGHYQFHPVLLDASLQLFAATRPDSFDQNGGETYVPASLERFCFYSRPGTQLNSHAVVRTDNGLDERSFVGDVQLFDEQGQVVAEVIGVRFQRAPREALLRTIEPKERASSPTELLRQLDEALPNERLDLLAGHLQLQVMKVLGLESAIADSARPLNEFGLDSLMAIELRNALERSVGCSLPATLLFDYPTIEGLTNYLATSVLSLQLAAAPVRESSNDVNDVDEWAEVSAKLDQLPEDELAALLANKLEAIESEVKRDE